MTIKNKLYTAFTLILLITLFIIGIFFYSTYNLSVIHELQNQRYEQIRRVEKVKELNRSFAWLVLDIIVDKEKNTIVMQRKNKAELFFKQLWKIEKHVVNNSETKEEKVKLEVIFKYLKIMQNYIENDLESMILNNDSTQELNNFNNKFKSLSISTEVLIEEEIDLLQNKLNQDEQDRENFITRIKLELIALIFISFCLSFIISTKLITQIKTMLKKLNNAILFLLSNKEQTIKVDIQEGNELSEITNNLNKYLQQKEDIITSREELLRNISHELKTPITKGKFLIEKIKRTQNDETISNISQVLYDIEELTNKLLEREKLNFATLNISHFKITTLILESLSKLSIDDESIIDIDIGDDFEINGDFYYLTLAVKNLIDNAIKYSDTLPIKISTKNNTLIIKNQAKKLSKNLVYYIQPFTREPNQQTGHGLGLNIVNKILQLHGYKINYTYEHNYNIFKINFK